MASKCLLPQVAMARRQMASVASQAQATVASHKVEVCTLVPELKRQNMKGASFQNSLLPSGLRVTSLDSDSVAVATLGVLVKSGSCYETYDTLGASHAIRASVGMSNRNASSFALVKNLQQMGGQLNVVGSRDFLFYSMSVPRNVVGDAFDILNEVVTSPLYNAWELTDNVYNRMQREVSSVEMSTQAIELLHKAAFRHGLGNSLYSPDYMIGKHKTGMLQAFHDKTHTVTR